MEYTSTFREQVILSDGTRLQLRAIQPSDKAALADGFAQLSPDSRRRRFHTAKSGLSDTELRFLTECDGQAHYAIVAYVDDETTGAQIGLGVARFARADDDPVVAELGITVADAWQGRGVGGVLLNRIIAAAAERGFERIRAVILADNERMKHLIAKSLDHATYQYENGLMSIEQPISTATTFDETLSATLRRLTLGTMTIPLRIGEQTMRGLLELGRTHNDKHEEI